MIYPGTRNQAKIIPGVCTCDQAKIIPGAMDCTDRCDLHDLFDKWQLKRGDFFTGFIDSIQ